MAPSRAVINATLPARRRPRRCNWKRQSSPAVANSQQEASESSNPAINGVLIQDARPHLWLTESNLELRFGELLETVRGQRDLQEISIYNILSRFSSEEMSCLYDAIAQFPLLQSFTVWSSQCLTVPVLTSVLNKAQRLQALTLSNLQINSHKEVLQLAQAILQHSSLTKLALDNLQITMSSSSLDSAFITLDPLLHAIAQNPRIESLRISASNDSNINTTTVVAKPDSLAALCRHSQLKELSLWNVELTDEALQGMARVLSSNQSSSCLESLTLRNCGTKLTHQGYASLVTMLQHNLRLQKVLLDTTNKSLQWQIEFLCYLNKCGTRRALLDSPANASVWLNALACHSHDLDSLFYLLGEGGGSNVVL
ncbi:expressed unknown protein [Seminavis robusta]|uniref:Uncharacterized protein n=1 Tax=Seminavis robusta TaxID=568900 RepID=A0A9N8HJB0_9STRA|nr:expressed unknown protein [Seminavis robusta]|eukprot:Sro847_g210380.1 n/a (369) ;mRNA; r:40913-42019